MPEAITEETQANSQSVPLPNQIGYMEDEFAETFLARAKEDAQKELLKVVSAYLEQAREFLEKAKPTDEDPSFCGFMRFKTEFHQAMMRMRVAEAVIHKTHNISQKGTSAT